MITKVGFVSILLFVIMAAGLAIGLIGLTQARRCYHIAQEQYFYYQKNYLLEGLLNYGISLAHNDFDAMSQKEKKHSVTLHEQYILNKNHYEGAISITFFDKDLCKITVSLHSSADERTASCMLNRNRDNFFITAWQIT